MFWLLLTPFFGYHWHGEQWRYLTYTQNLPNHDVSGSPAPWLVLRHYWSLAVEEQFYLVWPLVVYWVRGWRRLMWVCVLGSAVALGLRTWMLLAHRGPQNHSTPFCMDALLMGGILALLVRTRCRDVTLRLSPWMLGAAVLLIGVPALTRTDFAWETSPYLTTVGLTVVNVGAVGLVGCGLRAESWVQRGLSLGVLRSFGKYSYGLYVVHYTLNESLGSYCRNWMHGHGASKAVAILLPAAVVLAASLILALVSFHLYEKHFLKLKRFFVAGRGSAREA